MILKVEKKNVHDLMDSRLGLSTLMQLFSYEHVIEQTSTITKVENIDLRKCAFCADVGVFILTNLKDLILISNKA